MALGKHKYLKCCSTQGQVKAKCAWVFLLLIYQDQVHFYICVGNYFHLSLFDQSHHRVSKQMSKESGAAIIYCICDCTCVPVGNRGSEVHIHSPPSHPKEIKVVCNRMMFPP